MYEDKVQFRASTDMSQRIEQISRRTGLKESEVCRRLVRLGFDDIDQIGDEALLVAAPDPQEEQPVEG